MPRLLKALSRLRDRTSSFATARGGNVTILFGFSLIPMIGLIGLGIDHGIATSAKTKLDNAADSAAIAAVATAKSYLAANSSQPNVTANAITAGINMATNTFNVNAGNVPFAQVVLQTPQLTRTGQTFSSSISYTATVQNHFGQLFHQPTINLSTNVTATAQIPSYLDFYLMVDVSGSMGLPATTTGMTQLASVNNDMYYDYQQGCQFACHFPGYSGWSLAAGKIQLRSDAVNSAVCSLIQQASSPSVPNQYRVGIYPFINQMATLTAITSNMATLSTAAQCNSSWPMALTNLLDTGTTQLPVGNDPSTGTGSGGTHFEVAMPQMQNTVSPYGDGSTATNSKPFVFLITDGMENNQHFYTWQYNRYNYPGNPSTFPGYGDAVWDGSQPAQMNPANCTALKTAGATISILYIPYDIISYVNNSGSVVWENAQVNSFSPTLSTALQQCASPGYFYTADTPADITAALNNMFNQAIQVAHLTK